MNSIKFKASLFAKHWTYQTLNEWINACVAILPIEKYKLLKFSAQMLLLSLQEKGMTVKLSRRIIQSNPKPSLCRGTYGVFDSKRISKYLHCDYAEWKIKLKFTARSIYAPVKVNPDLPTPGYRWRLVLKVCKKRQMPQDAGQKIAENAPPLEQLKMFLMS